MNVPKKCEVKKVIEDQKLFWNKIIKLLKPFASFEKIEKTCKALKRFGKL